MTMKIKIKIILQHLNNHKNVPEILSRIFIKF